MRQPPAADLQDAADPSLVEQVHARIAGLLDSGAFPAGTRLPPERTLAAEFKVNRLTVNKALARFVDNGRLNRRVGSGTWVCEPTRESELQIVDIHLPANERMDEGASAILGRPGVVEGVHDYFRNRAVRIAVSFFRGGEDLLARLARTADHPGSAQLVWYRPDPALREALRALHARGRIVCLIDNGDAALPTPVVATDNFQGGLIAAEALLQAGRRRLAYVTLTVDQESLRERLAGFRCGAERGGATLAVHEVAGEGETTRLLAQGALPDGLAASNDWIALEAMRWLRGAGHAVPRDVAIVGYDDIEPGRYCEPALTTVAQDFYGIGFRAADVVDRSWNRPEASGRSQFLGPKLIRRGSL